MITAVILCGGSGTRLWPASRTACPKQFLRLTGYQSSLQNTVLRVAGLDGFTAPLLITGKQHQARVRQQLAAIASAGRLFIEPCGRGSGPAIAAAATYLLERDPEAILLVLASDHHVANVPAFRAALPGAVAAARTGHIVTFGMKPTHPATGYGYIGLGSAFPDIGGPDVGGAYRVSRFAEKPDEALARDYISAGYLWNSGNFLFRADVILGELAAFEPAMLAAATRAVALGRETAEGFCLDEPSFAGAPGGAIDTAVMERTSRAVVIPSEVGWSDIGTWNAIWDVSDKDESGNTAAGDALLIDSRNTLVRADGVLVTAIGLDDIVVVATADAVLVCRRDASQAVREAVERLSRDDRRELASPPCASEGRESLFHWIDSG